MLNSPASRQVLYVVGAVASAIVTVLAIFRIIDATTSTSLVQVIAALSSALGAGAAGTAAVVVSRQRKDGTYDISGTPVDQALAALKAITDQRDAATADFDRVQALASQVLGPAAVAPATPASGVVPLGVEHTVVTACGDTSMKG